MNIGRYVSHAERDERGEKILRAAWLLSLWAPLSTAVAYYFGQSSVLLADLFRRSIELLALWMAWYVFRRARSAEGEGRPGRARIMEKRSSLFMAVVMAASGLFIFHSAWLQFLRPRPPGWILPGVLVAGGGLIVNSYFWYRNWHLSRLPGRPILESQWRFYRAKTVIDSIVLITLYTTAYDLLGPRSWLADPVGAALIACFLLFSAERIVVHVVRTGGDDPE